MSKGKVLLFCAAIALIIGAVDIYLYIDDIPGNSITQIIVEASSCGEDGEAYPMVPALIGGFLIGLLVHFFDTTKQGD